MATRERPPDDDLLRGIAHAIAVGVNELLPPGFEASELDDDVQVTIRGELVGQAGVGSILRARGCSPTGEDMAEVAANVLSWLQDLVSDDRTWPWPPVPGKARGYMAAYRAAVRDGQLRLWFEADGRPVTKTTAVPLSLGPTAEQAVAPDGGPREGERE